MTRLKFFFIAGILIAGLAAAPLRAAYSPVAGDLVKGSLSAVYYVTADGKRLAFPNETAYFSWYADFNGVKTITDDELAALPLAGLVTIRPGTKIVKFATGAKTYAVAHNGLLRALANEDIAKMIFGADWSKKVAVVPDAFLASYKFGVDIGAAGQYWWAHEKDASPNIAADLDPLKAPDATVPAAPIVPVAVAPVVTPPTVAPVAAADPNTKNILFVLWDPKRPTAAAPDKAVFERTVFGAAPSVADYLRVESNGKVHLANAGVLGWYSADYPSDHYWTDDAVYHKIDGFKTGAAERYAEALKKSEPDFDYKKYDANNDGALSADELSVVVVIPQYGDPVDGTAAVDSAETPTVVPMTLDGVTVTTIGTLYVSTPLASAPQFGTITHYFMKYVFGASDVSTNNGAFSLMSDPMSDLFLDPYTRISLGWVTPKKVTKVQEISSQDIAANGSVIRIDRDQPSGPPIGSEYFLIENRQRDIYDNALPDTGIAIWDVSGSSPSLVRLNTAAPYNDAQALWHLQNDSLLSTARELTWSDSVRSGVRLLGIGASGPVMSITLENRVLTVQDLVPLPSPIQDK